MYVHTHTHTHKHTHTHPHAYAYAHEHTHTHNAVARSSIRRCERCSLRKCCADNTVREASGCFCSQPRFPMRCLLLFPASFPYAVFAFVPSSLFLQLGARILPLLSRRALASWPIGRHVHVHAYVMLLRMNINMAAHIHPPVAHGLCGHGHPG